MIKDELSKLSESERECLDYARGDFWNEFYFRERVEDCLQDIERVVFRSGNIEKLPEYGEELHELCSEAATKWKHYAKKALEEFHEYEEGETV
jgi:hypothetical protein